MNRRRVLSIILAAAIVCGGVFGVSAAVRKTTGSNASVLVVSAQELNYGGDWNMDSEMEGYVTSGKMQNVYVGETETVKEVYVKEGDQVKKGDLLLAYDMEKTELELEKAKLSKTQVEMELDTAKRNLQILASLRPVSDSPDDMDDDMYPDDDMWDDDEELPEEDDIEDEVKLSGKAVVHTQLDENAKPFYYTGGDADKPGTQDNPYRFLCTKDTVVLPGFITYLKSLQKKNGSPVYYQLEIREKNKLSGGLLREWKQSTKDLPTVSDSWRAVLRLNDTEDLTSEVEALKKELEKTQKSLDSANEALEKLAASDANKLEKALAELEAELTGLQDELTGLQKESEELDQKLQENADALTGADEKIAQNAADAQSTAEQTGQVQSELEELRALEEKDPSELSDEEKAKLEEKPALEQQLSELEQQQAALEAEAETLAGERTKLEEEKASLEQQKSELSGKVSSLAEKADALAVKISDPEGIITQIRERINALIGGSDTLQKDVAAFGESLGAASPVSEAAPTGAVSAVSAAGGRQIPEGSFGVYRVVRAAGKHGGAVLTDGYGADAVLVDADIDSDPAGGAGAADSSGLISRNAEMTKNEIAEAKREQEEIIRDRTLDLREADINIRIAQKAFEAGQVRAVIDGVVKKAGQPGTVPSDGTSFLQVAGTAGLSIRSAVAEINLEKVHEGDPVLVTSWQTGMRYTGKISEISPYPDTSNMFSMSMGSNSSYYPIIAVLDDPEAELEDNEWMQVQIGAAAAAGAQEEGLSEDEMAADPGDEMLMDPGDEMLMDSEDEMLSDDMSDAGISDEDLSDEDLSDGDMSADAADPGAAEFWLLRAFIRTDDGPAYVYKRGEDGLLKKQYVKLGRLSGDSYVIKSGVDSSDYLAFPYGKQVKEGAKTHEGTMEDMYAGVG